MRTTIVKPIVQFAFHHKHADRIKNLQQVSRVAEDHKSTELTVYVKVPSKKNRTGKKIFGWLAM